VGLVRCRLEQRWDGLGGRGAKVGLAGRTWSKGGTGWEDVEQRWDWLGGRVGSTGRGWAEEGGSRTKGGWEDSDEDEGC
jgi:hypothetical protein